MRNGNTGTSEFDEGIRKRLQMLAERHSQADMARACGTSRANISRYLSGNRIPAGVCAALAKQLGVNPTWLLTGEGSQNVADIDTGHAQMATDLLAVVEAMSAVARMRLGALTGKNHLKALRELDDALRRFEDLREKLNEKSRPILSQLLDDWDRAWDGQHPARSHQTRRAAEQVARLCDDEELEFRLLKAQAMDDLIQGDSKGALETQRHVALRAIVRTETWDSEVLLAVKKVTYLLEGQGRAAESIALCKAARELAVVYGASHAEIAELDAQIGDVLTEIGRIDEGLPSLQRAMSFLSDNTRVKWMGPWAYAQFFAGSVEFGQVAVEQHAKGNSLFGGQLIQIAIWLEDPKAVQRAMHIYDTLRGDSTADPETAAIQGAWVLRSIERPTEKTYREAIRDLGKDDDDRDEDAHRQFLVRTYEAQLAHLCGLTAEAKKALDRAEAVRIQIPEDVHPVLIAPALFHRQSLRVLSDAKTARHRKMYANAREWFRSLYERGYGRFRDFASD